MNSTMETMPNETKQENQFYGDFLKKEETRENAMLGLIKNQKIMLEEEFAEAKEKYAGRLLKDKYCPETYEAEFKCRLIEAKMDIVSKIQKDLENMLSPSFAIAS